MAKRTTKSSILGKLSSAKKAYHAHRSDSTEFDTSGNLPAGIDDGVAKLVDCKFSTYEKGDNKGEPFFYAAGIVVAPKTHEGIPIQGKRTSITEPFCSTPGKSRETVDAHFGWILNELRKLGVPVEEIEFEDLEDVIATLKEDNIHFRFRTWAGEPNPPKYPKAWINHVWDGACEYEDDEDDLEDVTDETVDEEPEDEEPEEAEEVEEEAPVVSSDDLGEQGDAGDEDAQQTLTDNAEALGLDANDYATWTEVSIAIEDASGGEPEPEDNEPEEPEKGTVVKYKPMGKRKAIECEVTAVFTGKQTVNLKNLDDGKFYKGVSWKDIAEAE